ncbi:MAG: DUF1743 domain-containing protein, partial [Methanosarcinales archaeon]|nr:DUF1743 domain-containing protein [Methanosarcinales archaeon]
MLTIGIDDTDSEKGLCTTYLAAVLMDRLEGLGHLVGLPRLVRLNPCARFKTRGNAAIAFSLETEREEEVREVALSTLLELSDLSGENTNPGMVIAREVSPEMTEFYRRAVTEILEIREARELIQELGLWHRGFKKQRGLIGALAAVGADFPDHTYELIAYREPGRWGVPRQIDTPSVWEADAETYPHTWDTVDHASRRIVFAPHSPDPVLFGIRGDDPEAISRAFNLITSETPERMALYRTNQGTDAHILNPDGEELRENRSYRLRGTVAGAPRDIAGGHVFFSLEREGQTLECAAFEPTKGFRRLVRALVPGDRVEVYGALRSGTVNLEKLEVHELAASMVEEAPICPVCGRRMKSAGKGQGYRCRRCRTREEALTRRPAPRDVETGLYEVPPCARRHLS